MTNDRQLTIKVGGKIGAVIGAILFLVLGLVPAFFVGSHATLLLLASFTGGSVEPTTLVRMLLVIGAVVGIFLIALLSIMAGAVMGAALGYFTDIVSQAFRPAEKGVKSKS